MFFLLWGGIDIEKNIGVERKKVEEKDKIYMDI